MKRQLHFYSSDRGAVAGWLRRAADSGARRGVIIGDAEQAGLGEIVRQAPLSWSVASVDTENLGLTSATDVVLIAVNDAAKVSQELRACIDCHGVVIAPITKHHYSRRTIFLLSMPKAGTHMAIRLLGLMGIERSSDRAPAPGTWSTPVGYEYHAPCRELLANDWFDPVGRQLWLRSPALFIYRDPRDIVVSELDWFAKSEHAFSGYLRSCKDDGERLERLIADATVMGTIRDRVNRYVGWVHFRNVIAVSYEELVGGRGGGSDGAQCDTVWSLQLKLHIPGDPLEFAAQLYDPASPTFSQGRIGRHRQCFTARHYELFDALPQDFMQALGYDRDSNLSAKVAERRHDALEVKEIQPELLYLPRLVRQGVKDNNIVELAGRYFPVPQGEQLVSARDGQAFSESNRGFATLRDAIDAALHANDPAAPIRADRPPTELVVESYCGFNIVRHTGHWYGFDQVAGPLNLDELGAAGVERMVGDGTCVSGENLADVKAEILRCSVQKLARDSQQEAERQQQGLAELKQQLAQVAAALKQAEAQLQAYVNLGETIASSRTEARESSERLATALGDRLESLRAELQASDRALAAMLQKDLTGLRDLLPDWLADAGPESAALPRLVEAYQGFSLVAYDRRIWAVRQDVGALDLRDHARRDAWVAEGKILVAYSTREARATIDQVCALQTQWREREARLAAEFASQAERFDRQIARTQQEAIAAAEAAQQAADQAYRKSQADVRNELEALRHQLNDAGQTIASEWRQSLAQTAGSLQAQLDEIQRDYFIRLGGYLRAHKGRLVTLGNKKDKG